MKSQAIAIPVVVILLRRPVLKLGRRLFQWLCRRYSRADRFDGLDNVVSYTARLIAGIRAVESMKGDGALFIDPLARTLAGTKALAAKMQSEATQREAQEKEGKGGEGAPRSAGRIQIRTLYFDDAVRVAVGAVDLSSTPEPSSTGRISAGFAKGDRPVPTALKDMGCAIKEALQGGWCKQVVLLGAGMDTRAWRLQLPPGVTWVEVDQADVLASKSQAMTRMGASFGAAPSSTTPSSTSTGSTSQATDSTVKGAGSTAAAADEQHKMGRGKGHGQDGRQQGSGLVKFPLRAGRYVSHAADLQQPGWAHALVASGALDPQVPTLWVLEGLTYYLEPASVPVMLGEIGSVSPPGSALVGSIASAAAVARIQARKRGSDDAMGAWKWGAPGGPAEWATYFEHNLGTEWSVVGSPYWVDVAPQYGLVADTSVYSNNTLGGKSDKQASGQTAGQTNGPQQETNGSGMDGPRGGYVTAVRL